MTDEQWQRAWQLFEAADDVSPENRQSFLSEQTADPVVRDAVFAMLERSSPADNLDRIGQKAGQYLITGRLGQGGMGEVYAARDTGLSRSVAMKFVASSRLGAASSVERLVREAKAVSALNHPNIVTVYEVIHSTSQLAIVMELVDGMPLPSTLRHAAAGRSSAPCGRADRQSARRRPYARHRPPRHQTRKPDDPARWRREGGRFRPRARHGLGRFDFGGRRRHAARYVARAVARRAAVGAQRHLLLGVVLYELATGTHPFQSGSIFELSTPCCTSILPPHRRGMRSRLPRSTTHPAHAGQRSAKRPAAADVAKAFELAPSRGGPYRSPPRRAPGVETSRGPPPTALLACGLALALWAPWRTSRVSTDRPSCSSISMSPMRSRNSPSRRMDLRWSMSAATSSYFAASIAQMPRRSPAPRVVLRFFSPTASGSRSSPPANCEDRGKWRRSCDHLRRAVGARRKLGEDGQICRCAEQYRRPLPSVGRGRHFASGDATGRNLAESPAHRWPQSTGEKASCSPPRWRAARWLLRIVPRGAARQTVVETPRTATFGSDTWSTSRAEALRRASTLIACEVSGPRCSLPIALRPTLSAAPLKHRPPAPSASPRRSGTPIARSPGSTRQAACRPIRTGPSHAAPFSDRNRLRASGGARRAAGHLDRGRRRANHETPHVRCRIAAPSCWTPTVSSSCSAPASALAWARSDGSGKIGGPICRSRSAALLLLARRQVAALRRQRLN